MYIEQCPKCLSINTLYPPDFQAWECYFCGSRYWESQHVKQNFMMNYNISEEEADKMMESADSSIFFVSGY